MTDQAIAPQDLPAEEYVLGALMLAGDPDSATFDLILETGLRSGDFYLKKHGRIFAAAYALRDRREPVHAITLTEELRRRGELDQSGGTVKLHELSALALATANAPHFARLVVDASQRRHAIRVGGEMIELGRGEEHGAGLVLRAQELVEELAERSASADELKPLWWHEAVVEPVPDTSEYVDGVLQAGVLADIVGLPYLHKTAIALELATKIARGEGKLFGKFDIQAQANVAYFWSDDSRAKELERIQAYAAVCQHDVVPLAFYLNSGLVLPEGVPMLKAQIRRHGFRLIVLDSLYNFAPGLDWVKDTPAVSLLYHQLKRLCDQTEGLTIVLVDHASKPSDSNRGRDVSVSSYGSVWKAAAVRSSIVITKDAKGLKATAIGNNIRGFPSVPVAFDEDALELRIVQVQEPMRDVELDEIVLREVQRNPGASLNRIRKNVSKRKQKVSDALQRLAEDGQICRATESLDGLEHTATASGEEGWIPLNHAEKVVPGTTDPSEADIWLNHAEKVVPDDAEPPHGENAAAPGSHRNGNHPEPPPEVPRNQAEKVVPAHMGTTPEPPDPGTVTGSVPASGSRMAPLRSRGPGIDADPETVDPDPEPIRRHTGDDIDFG